MPDITVTIPEGFKYVGVALVSTQWLLFIQYRNVMAARQKYNVSYPQMYADKSEMDASKDKYMFNCVQRTHQNTLENLPLLYTSTIIVGLKYPILAAALCGSWVIGKYAYSLTYWSGNTNPRTNPAYVVFSLVPLLVFPTHTARKLLLFSLYCRPIMSASLVPQGFGYVGAALVSTIFLLIGQSQVVSIKRKKAGIEYPQMYADKLQEKESKDALVFNCAQRAHQNTLENIPIVYVTTIVAGLQYPVYSASVCAFWVLSRILYTRGYISGDPKKRVSVAYGLATVGLLGNLACATYTAAGWVMQNLNL
ncbi:hypothetical protein MD484_g8260, partial [Candolleomyces efflorescens]